MGRQGVKLDSKVKSKILAYYKQGHTMEEISIFLDCSVYAVHKWIKLSKANKSHRKTFAAQDIIKVVNKNSNLSLREISNHPSINMSCKFVQLRLKQHGFHWNIIKKQWLKKEDDIYSDNKLDTKDQTIQQLQSEMDQLKRDVKMISVLEISHKELFQKLEDFKRVNDDLQAKYAELQLKLSHYENVNQNQRGISENIDIKEEVEADMGIVKLGKDDSNEANKMLNNAAISYANCDDVKIEICENVIM